MIKNSPYFIMSILVLLLFIASCDLSPSNKGQSEKANSNNKDLTFDEKLAGNINYDYIEINEKNCGSVCAYVTVNYPISQNRNFNKLFNAQLAKAISGDVSVSSSQDIIDAGNEFISLFTSFKKEFKEVSTPWYVDIDAEITYQQSDWLCFKIKTGSYSGGAHSNSSVRFLLFNQNGSQFTVNKTITDTKNLLIQAEKAFRRQANIPPAKQWNETEYSFAAEGFFLPEEIGFSEKGMILYYNNYEIASYAEGSIEIVLPYDQIKSYLSAEYFN